MSYEEFRRRIDTARNILVGAVPSPAGQIDQITYALMYKFMNDIDDQSASLGGIRSYFIDDYEQYNWHSLMSPSLGAHERLERYRQAIQTMGKNPNIPELFRGIYQNAFLPFNSSNVLNLFLKEIDKFNYGESDDIGDAYEYLLSITGAQGDVGQFRTPRHIIKFIVEAVNPTKDDAVIDPACGTAGFLIAAYNHVRSQHDGKDQQGNANDERRLSTDEWDKIHHNYRGFDIDPTMVRTAKVNMYLHGFKTPDIINHDSLSSEEYWNDRYDVILANPPFMTPKGGILPHKKFGITANRAEVLFVDYIASHLKPTGRAGIIVPEGIIFQSGKTYKELRKNLVENYLYAVVSMPSGIFNPYAGVKTSILLLDKELAKQRDEILFVKVENDGYSLGAQRRPVAGNQLPEALEVIERFKSGEEMQSELVHAVARADIAESGNYNLSGDRYKAVALRENNAFPMVEIKEVADVKKGSAITRKDVNSNGVVPVVAGGQQPAYSHDISNRVANTITVSASGAYAGFVNYWPMPIFASDCSTIQSNDENVVLQRYLYVMLKYQQNDIYKLQSGGGQPHIYPKDIQKLKIPLPPIEIQRQIVAELDSYQHIIDSAQTIAKIYKPTIKINPQWEKVELGDHVRVNNGQVLTEFDDDGKIACVKVGDMNLPENSNFIVTSSHWTNRSLRGLVEKESVIFPKRGAAIATNKKRLNKILCYIDNNCMAITPNNRTILNSYYLYYFMLGFNLASISNSAGIALINNPDIKSVKIPLPSIEEQTQIVAELEDEQKLIDANKQLIEIFQQKIKSKIAEIWGE
jgi:type I restriction enzyme M protein